MRHEQIISAQQHFAEQLQVKPVLELIRKRNELKLKVQMLQQQIIIEQDDKRKGKTERHLIKAMEDTILFRTELTVRRVTYKKTQAAFNEARISSLQEHAVYLSHKKEQLQRYSQDILTARRVLLDGIGIIFFRGERKEEAIPEYHRWINTKVANLDTCTRAEACIVLEYVVHYLRLISQFLDIELPFKLLHSSNGVSICIDNVLFSLKPSKSQVLRYTLAICLLEYDILYACSHIGLAVERDNVLVLLHKFHWFHQNHEGRPCVFELNLGRFLESRLKAERLSWELSEEIEVKDTIRRIFNEHAVFSVTSPMLGVKDEWDLVERDAVLPPPPTAYESEFLMYQ